ncbi:MAG TPA: hypothetical protein VIG40_07825 [Tissierellaceae bacterium]
MEIRESSYKGLESIEIETDKLLYRFIPKLGLKLASIYIKEKEKEILYQSHDDFKLPKYKDKYLDYDISGIDDIIPTLEPCKYPNGKYEGLNLPDRGDVWNREVETKITNNSIKSEILLKSLPLKFEKEISLKDDLTLNMKYKVTNLSDYDSYYLWTLQNYLYFSENAEFIFDKADFIAVNVLTNEDLTRYNLKNLNEYRDDRNYKYFFWGKRKNGIVGINYKDEQIVYKLEYDVDKIPYLGIFINRKNNKISIEPTNSFFDSIEVAYDNNSIHEIKGKAVDEFDIDLKIEY